MFHDLVGIADALNRTIATSTTIKLKNLNVRQRITVKRSIRGLKFFKSVRSNLFGF